MAQYPVSDGQGIIDGLNYVLSGPIGTGQLFRGTNTDVNDSLSGYSINTETGQLYYNLPIVTAYEQNYITDMFGTVSVYSGQDRVAISGAIELDWDYKAYTPSTIQLTVAINRYVAQPTFDPSYNAYLYFFDSQVAVQQFDYIVDTSSGGISSVSVAGTKANLVAPAGGSLYPAVDTVLTGLTAQSPGVGTGANIGVQLAYGAATTYDLTTNTKLTINAAGENWVLGDTILVPGTSLGGATPTNDMTMTVDGVVDNYITESQSPVIFPTIYDLPGRPGVYLYAIELQWLAVSGNFDIDGVTLKTRSISTQLIKP